MNPLSWFNGTGLTLVLPSDLTRHLGYVLALFVPSGLCFLDEFANFELGGCR